MYVYQKIPPVWAKYTVMVLQDTKSSSKLIEELQDEETQASLVVTSVRSM
jgi:hypothetical protein